MSTPLTHEEREYLLHLARTTIENATNGVEAPATEMNDLASALTAPGAAFVTLHTRSGDLRGCIGSLVAHQPLVKDVHDNALSAAFEDPRFRPVTAAELQNLVVEISVLTAPEPLAFDGPDDLLEKLRPHVDGVVIEKGWHRATFLPQVWDQLPDGREFLAHLCMKAGLPYDAWRKPGLKVSIYQVEEFSE